MTFLQNTSSCKITLQVTDITLDALKKKNHQKKCWKKKG